MVWLPWNEKQAYQLNSRPQMWPSGLTLAMTLTLNFHGQIWNLLYLSQKSSDFLETKSKYNDWTLGIKCDHQVWPWPWPWPWIFKVKYGICYISTKSGHIDWTPCLKCDQWVWPLPWPWPLNFQGQMWPWSLTTHMALTMDSCISEWEGQLTLYKGDWSRLFMTMTIWWPRSGLRIYQIVTGVTSNVGVLSTRLVDTCCHWPVRCHFKLVQHNTIFTQIWKKKIIKQFSS